MIIYPSTIFFLRLILIVVNLISIGIGINVFLRTKGNLRISVFFVMITNLSLTIANLVAITEIEEGIISIKPLIRTICNAATTITILISGVFFRKMINSVESVTQKKR